MTQIGLSLNEEKTCIRNARHEPFNFLGYTFGIEHSPRTGTAYLGAKLSRKALERAREKISSILHRGNNAPWEMIAKLLNATLKGWANYYAYGTVSHARKAVDAYVCDRVRAFLLRRHKVSRGGSRKRFAWKSVHAELGVLLSRLLRRSEPCRETCPRAG